MPDAPVAPEAARRVTERLPAHAYFVVSAVFHYLGPAFAVLLFARLDPLGVRQGRRQAAKTAAAIEFVPVIVLAAVASRTAS
jgi:inner membrane transporter RhtA